jgi:hypothetical protein
MRRINNNEVLAPARYRLTPHSIAIFNLLDTQAKKNETPDTSYGEMIIGALSGTQKCGMLECCRWLMGVPVLR